MLLGSYFLHIITSVLRFKYGQSKHQHFQLVMKLATPSTFLPVVYRHVFLSGTLLLPADITLLHVRSYGPRVAAHPI